MAKKLLGEKFVQDKIIDYLRQKGWSKNLVSKTEKQHGVDIRVKNDKVSRYWLIETKGDPYKTVKSLSGSRSSSFNSAIGQIISRMHTKRMRGYKYGYKYGLGFPDSFKNKVIKRLPYDVCDKLNLYVFLVNKKGEVSLYGWKKLKELQNT